MSTHLNIVFEELFAQVKKERLIELLGLHSMVKFVCKVIPHTRGSV